MRILVTGANGFLGAAICRAALSAGHEVHGTVRHNSALDLLDSRVVTHVADLCDETRVLRAVETAAPDAVVHNAAIPPVGRPDRTLSERVNVGGTAAVIQACVRSGCRRLVHISSMSAQPENQAVYGSTKRRSEEAVRNSELDWTILRPSLVYGPGDRSVFAKMIRMLRKMPVLPILGSGTEPVRPIHVDDCAAAVVAVLNRPVTFGKTYCLGGKDALDVGTMLRITAEALGRQPIAVHIPFFIARLLAMVLEPIMANPPVTRDNLEGAAKAAFCDIEDAVRDFGFAPRAYREGLADCGFSGSTAS